MPFSEPVEVHTDGGWPYLRIQIGRKKIDADYLRTQGSKAVFGHVVAEGELDVFEGASTLSAMEGRPLADHPEIQRGPVGDNRSRERVHRDRR